MQELFERRDLFEQLLSFVRIFDADAVLAEILQQRPAVDIASGDHRLLAALERFVLHQLNAVAVVNQRVSGYSCLLLIRLAEPSVDHDQFDRLLLVDHSLRVVDIVGAGEVDRVPVRLVGDLHGRQLRAEVPGLGQAQAPDGPLDLLVDRLPEFVMPLPDNDHRSVRIAHDLKDRLDGCLG